MSHLFKLENIFKHRSEQIQREADFDRQMDKLPCQEILYSYYRFRRILNRQQYDQFQKTPFWEKFSLAKQQLHDVDTLDEDLDGCLKYPTPCDCIHNLLRDIEFQGQSKIKSV